MNAGVHPEPTGRERLGAYLKEKNLSLVDFAPKVKTHAAHLGRLLSGERSPGLGLAFDIEQATGGAVPASSWVEKKPRHARRLTRRAS